jgi:hypothetical protein
MGTTMILGVWDVAFCGEEPGTTVGPIMVGDVTGAVVVVGPVTVLGGDGATIDGLLAVFGILVLLGILEVLGALFGILEVLGALFGILVAFGEGEGEMAGLNCGITLCGKRWILALDVDDVTPGAVETGVAGAGSGVGTGAGSGVGAGAGSGIGAGAGSGLGAGAGSGVGAGAGSGVGAGAGSGVGAGAGSGGGAGIDTGAGVGSGSRSGVIPGASELPVIVSISTRVISPSIPRAFAASEERSMMRLLEEGIRAEIVTTACCLFRWLVTLTRVPRGMLACAPLRPDAAS